MQIQNKHRCRNCDVSLFMYHQDVLSLCGDCRELPLKFMQGSKEFFKELLRNKHDVSVQHFRQINKKENYAYAIKN